MRRPPSAKKKTRRNSQIPPAEQGFFTDEIPFPDARRCDKCGVRERKKLPISSPQPCGPQLYQAVSPVHRHWGGAHIKAAPAPSRVGKENLPAACF